MRSSPRDVAGHRDGVSCAVGSVRAVSRRPSVGRWIVVRTVECSGGTVQFDADDGGTTVQFTFNPAALVESTDSS